eukprot:jgi/Hompol1/944/HPOL_001582-RA
MSIAITINRQRLFEDGFRQLKKLTGSQLKQTIRVKFVNQLGVEEIGIDRSGVFKEFLEDICRIAFSTENGDFTLAWASASSGATFLHDLPFRAYQYDADGGVQHYFRNAEETLFFGAGERSSPLCLNGRHVRLEATDALGYNPERTDPLYKHNALFYGLSRSTCEAFGVFYDSLTAGSLDFGCEIDAFWGSFCSYKSQSSRVLDYYVFFGPGMNQCVESFVNLVGAPAMVPRYALGYLASSMGYAEADNAQEMIEAFPSARNVFTWNKTRFPDPKRMFKVLREAGIRTVANIKPWLLAGHPKYAEMISAKGFVWDADTDSNSVTRLWSAGAGSTATGSYLDFSSEAGRSFWKAGVKSLLDLGVEGIWNDNNEFNLHDDQHVYSMFGAASGSDGDCTVGRNGRALQTGLMASASYEAMCEQYPAKRPYLITRSSCPGTHRYACQTWSGDNYSSWQTLKHNIPMGLNACLSAMGSYGHDVGGFVGPRPEKELFVRWVQNGIFQPRFCIHSWKQEGITEPWMYPDVVHIIRNAIQLRYKLIPYLYALHREASTRGSPVIRPLLYHFQNDRCVHETSFEYLLGPSLLVASVFEQGQRLRSVYLPQAPGVSWCNVWTGEWFTGGQTVQVPVPLEQAGALFARSGSLIPTGRVVQSAGGNGTGHDTHNDDNERIFWVFAPPFDPSQAAVSTGAFSLTMIEDDGVSAIEVAAVIEYTVSAQAVDSTSVAVDVSVAAPEAGKPLHKPKFNRIGFVLPLNDGRRLVTAQPGSGETQQDDGRQILWVPLLV